MLKSKHFTFLFLSFLLPFSSVSQSATTEEEQARTICFDVLHGIKQFSKTADSVCPYNEQSLSVWKCTQTRVNKGESFNFSMEQCKKNN